VTAALLRAAAARTRHGLAFTYPPNRWLVRAFVALQNLLRRLRGSPFRAFVHSPQRMSAALEHAGLVSLARRETFVWVFDLYRR
jgi:hypothetical protein